MSEQAAMSAVRKQREQTHRHYMHAPQVFLDAWKEGVTMAGAHMFMPAKGYFKAKSTDQAEDKWQLIPDVDSIRRYVTTCSVGEGIFIGALVSFYNSDIGGELFLHYGYTGLGDIADRLELEQLKVITELMLNHTGW